jgi:hypothetical protein
MAVRLIDLGDPTHYPVTNEASRQINEVLIRMKIELPIAQFKVIHEMVSTLLSYEHGEADVETVGVSLEQYSAVLIDLALVLILQF